MKTRWFQVEMGCGFGVLGGNGCFFGVPRWEFGVLGGNNVILGGFGWKLGAFLVV